MVTFPDYDYGLFGGTESAQANADPNFIEPSAGTEKPAPPFTLGVVYQDISTGAAKAGEGVTGALSGAYKAVAGTFKGVYWNLIGGVAIVGILAIVLLGVSGRFMRQMEGR